MNDPTTAVEVVLRIGSLLRRLLGTNLSPEVVVGADGRRLVRPWQLRHEEYLAHAFDQLRQHAAPQTQVLAVLLRVLRMLLAHVRSVYRPQPEQALRVQVELTLHAIRSDERICPADKARLEAIADEATDPADHSVGPPRASAALGPFRPRTASAVTCWRVTQSYWLLGLERGVGDAPVS